MAISRGESHRGRSESLRGSTTSIIVIALLKSALRCRSNHSHERLRVAIRSCGGVSLVRYFAPRCHSNTLLVYYKESLSRMADAVHLFSKLSYKRCGDCCVVIVPAISVGIERICSNPSWAAGLHIYWHTESNHICMCLSTCARFPCAVASFSQGHPCDMACAGAK